MPRSAGATMSAAASRSASGARQATKAVSMGLASPISRPKGYRYGGGKAMAKRALKSTGGGLGAAGGKGYRAAMNTGRRKLKEQAKKKTRSIRKTA